MNGVDQSQFDVLEDKKLLDGTSVLVTHVPPYGLRDKVFIGMHGGSKEVRRLVDTYKPQLVLCGHIHEDPGYSKKGKTLVVNCSMGKRGEGALITINKKITVEMLD